MLVLPGTDLVAIPLYTELNYFFPLIHSKLQCVILLLHFFLSKCLKIAILKAQISKFSWGPPRHFGLWPQPFHVLPKLISPPEYKSKIEPNLGIAGPLL